MVYLYTGWVGPLGPGAHILTVVLLIYALLGKLQRKSNPRFGSLSVGFLIAPNGKCSLLV